MRPIVKSRVFHGHIAAVTVAGIGSFVWLAVRSAGSLHLHHAGELAALAVLLIVSEQRPLIVNRRREPSAITLSAIFACAILLRWDIVVAVAIQAAASLIDDARARCAWWKRGFNLGQYSLSLVAAGLVYHAMEPAGSAAHMGDRRVVMAAVTAGAVFFLVNTVLMGTAVALSEEVRLRDLLAKDLGFQASVNGTMAGLAPIVVAVSDASLWLVPLLLLPAVAVYQGARLSLDKEHRSHHDALTELPNRVSFGEELEAAVEGGRRSGRSVGVLLMDIDDFRDLNDTLGHSAGDELLRMIGARLGQTLSAGGLLARLGGDEFGMLLPDLSDASVAADVAARILGLLEEPFDLDGVSMDVRASVGIAVFPEHGRGVDELVRHADIAMYLAKRNRSGYEVYDAARNEHSRRRLTLLNELRQAISTPSLVVYYQPKADMHSGTVSALEALLRWPHPVLGMVAPDEFVTLAEQTGLIRPLTEFVLDEVCDQLAHWRAEGIAVPVAVNVSARILHDGSFPARIAERLARFGLPPSLLILEITETAIMAEPDSSLRVLDELSGMGIRLSVDDFGIGYSSLAYLSRLPVSEVKIDRSFVTHLDDRPNNRVIVASTIDLARNLGLEVVAEGVETIPEWQTLASLGCTTAQGYLVSRPEPASAATELLRRGAAVPVVEEFAVTFGVNRSSGAVATTLP